MISSAGTASNRIISSLVSPGSRAVTQPRGTNFPRRTQDSSP